MRLVHKAIVIGSLLTSASFITAYGMDINSLKSYKIPDITITSGSKSINLKDYQITLDKNKMTFIITPVKCDTNVVYDNNEYGFKVNLPNSWKGYTIVNDEWEGMGIGTGTVKETGPLISIRHPLWTEENPYQDIPIMVFTIRQWNAMNKDEFHIGAAPINPSELARNSKYVFALPARYNFSYLTGFEEVQEIIDSKAVVATENISN